MDAATTGEAIAADDTAMLCHIAESARAISTPEAAPSASEAPMAELGTSNSRTTVTTKPPMNAVPTAVMARARRLQ